MKESHHPPNPPLLLARRAQCEAAGATLGKLVEENSELADRLNWQSAEIAQLRAALGAQHAQRGGEGDGEGEENVAAARQEEEEGVGLRPGPGGRRAGAGGPDGGGEDILVELPGGMRLPESQLELMALAEEVGGPACVGAPGCRRCCCRCGPPPAPDPRPLAPVHDPYDSRAGR